METALGLVLDRFEPARGGSLHYAQVNIPDEASWRDVIRLIERIGPAIRASVRTSEIGRPCLDVMLQMAENLATASLIVPSQEAAAIGRWNVDIEVSAYLTGTQ